MILSKRDLHKFHLSIELEDKRIQNGNIIIWEGDWEQKKSRTNRYKKKCLLILGATMIKLFILFW